MSSYTNAPATAGPSRLHRVLGVWTKKSNKTSVCSDAVEVVARVETPPPAFHLPTPPPSTYSAHHHESRDSSTCLDDFFGAGALELHHPLSRTTAAPPPYVPCDFEVVEKHPEVYSIEEEPATLARMLFKYGFLFFPFWLAGIYILFSPLLPTPDWEAGKTEAEKTQLLHLIRNTEKKWARRCLYAMLGFTVTILLLVIIIKFGIMADI